MVDYEAINLESFVLKEEGLEICENGSHAARVFYAIPEGLEGISIADLNVFIFNEKKLGNVSKFGQGSAFKAKWISKSASGNLIRSVNYFLRTGKICC
jgi:phenylalanyl-tRNA synthetase alpha chain